MERIAISFTRSKNDLTVTCDLSVWRRLPNRYGYHEREYLEIQQGIMMCANVTVFCSENGFPAEGAEFPDTSKTCEAGPAILEVAGKTLLLTIPEYEHHPLKPLSTGNYGLFVEHYGLTRTNKARFDLKAWISFRPPGPVVKDKRVWTPGGLGSHFESNRRRH